MVSLKITKSDARLSQPNTTSNTIYIAIKLFIKINGEP
nr:MAG TPA: hypothetical protein [Crassvirales sp.]